MYLRNNNTTERPPGNEDRVYGPPGTGKTTYLGRQVNIAAKKYGGSNVMVTSFTRAAAAELVGRGLPVPNDNVGTLHAHCYRALGFPEIAEAHSNDWNRHAPGYRLSSTDLSVDEMSTERAYTGLGDEMYAEQQKLRARCMPSELWPQRVRRFHEKWTDWKQANGFIDFTDMLEIAGKRFAAAPRHPAVIFVDEAQDLTPQQLSLLRQWGRRAEHLVIAGDDDQTIYTFAGAEPEVLLQHDGPERFRHVLSQSWRVPRAVHAISESWIRRVAIREPKEYFPRDADGDVRLLRRGHYQYPEPILDDAERYLNDRRSIMFLATCGYMLQPLIAVLRKRGLPFHNPYRRKRTDWNPLYRPDDGREQPSRRSLTAAERLRALLPPHKAVAGEPWTAEDLVAWTAWLKRIGVLVPGAADRVTDGFQSQAVSPHYLRDLFVPAAYEQLIAALGQEGLSDLLSWWMAHLKPPRRRTAEYPVRVVERGGAPALVNTPQIIVGTGHSVKGGEADVVYLFPDLSPSGTRNWEGRRADRDSIVRLGYVMMTRAKESLVICEPMGTEFMPIGTLAARIARKGGGLK